MLDGVRRYRHHPYRRTLDPPDVAWREGTTRLLDYRALKPARAAKTAADGGAVVLVPSLINRAYILDLDTETSLARWLAGQGVDVFLVDWDAPGAAERGFDLAAYIARLNRAVAAAAESAGRPVTLLGYCMGGLLTLPLAAGQAGGIPAGGPVGGLVLLATPWDFHAEGAVQARALGASAALFEPAMRATGTLPTDVLQALFTALDPMLAMKKFAAFARMDPDSPRARAFVALEDWLNDGVPLAAPVARECLAGWYGANSPAAGTWALDGWSVDPAAVRVPSLALVPAGDRIVPPGSALALAEAIPGCRLARPAAGHIGMIVARGASERVWEPIRAFLANPAAAS